MMGKTGIVVNIFWNRGVLKKERWKIIYRGKYKQCYFLRIVYSLEYYLNKLLFKYFNDGKNYLEYKPSKKKIPNNPNKEELEEFLNKFKVKIITTDSYNEITIYTVQG